MNFEEWYAKLGEWAEENTALNMSYAMQRHLARRLEEWESSRPTQRAPDVCPDCKGKGIVKDGFGQLFECARCQGSGQRR